MQESAPVLRSPPVGPPPSVEAPTESAAPHTAVAPASPFTLDALLNHLAAPEDEAHQGPAAYLPEHQAEGPRHIPPMEPALAAAATVPFASLKDPAGAARLRHVLSKLGFAIVSGVISPDEAAAVERLFADDLRGIIDPARSDAAKAASLAADPVHRWDIDAVPLGAYRSVAEFGLPHGRAAWHARTHPNVRDSFAAVFGGTEEKEGAAAPPPLCTGADCVFFDNTPAVIGGNDVCVTDLWSHVDQNLNTPPAGETDCYQGVLYVWPATPDTSATVVWPRSHALVYPELMTRAEFKDGGEHFCMLRPTEQADFARNARRVPVPSGGLFLWNSRTIHQGAQGGARLAIPVCMEPASRRGADALARKRQCVLEGVPTSHWAALGIPHPIAGKMKEFTSADDSITVHCAAHAHCASGPGAILPEIAELL